MKILVYGSRGWIGNQFCSVLKKNYVNHFIGISRVDNDKSLEK